MTLVELIVAFTIMLMLTSMAVPLARAKVRAERERALRARSERDAPRHRQVQGLLRIGYFGAPKAGTNCWPETLEILVKGVKLAQSADGKKIRLLRRIPRDPFTNSTEWGMRSDQDEPDLHQLGRPGRVRCLHQDRPEGPRWTAYAEW